MTIQSAFPTNIPTVTQPMCQFEHEETGTLIETSQRYGHFLIVGGDGECLPIASDEELHYYLDAYGVSLEGWTARLILCKTCDLPIDPNERFCDACKAHTQQEISEAFLTLVAGITLFLAITTAGHLIKFLYS